MQIVEVTDFALRSAVLRLARADTPLRFEVFPMVHVAEPAFFAAVTERLRRCDLIVAEGVGGAEPPPAIDPELTWPGLEMEDLPPERRRRWNAASALTASYEIPARFERSGLIQDNINFDRLGVPVLYPDMTDAEFAAGFRAIPARQRAIALVAAPLAGLGRLAYGSRRSIARHLTLDDTDWHERRAATGPLDDLLVLMVDKRDELLLTALDAVHDTCSRDPITVAVVYGAMHVPAVLRGLRALHGYSVRSAEWLTVFELDE